MFLGLLSIYNSYIIVYPICCIYVYIYTYMYMFSIYYITLIYIIYHLQVN